MQLRLNAAMTRPLETMGQRLRHVRKLRGLTQQTLAASAEVEQPLVSKIELGLIEQTAAIARLASALRVSPMWLERGIGPAPSDVSTLDDVAPLMSGVAHGMSLDPDTILPTILGEEQIVSNEELPVTFRLAVKDDSAAPDYLMQRRIDCNPYMPAITAQARANQAQLNTGLMLMQAGRAQPAPQPQTQINCRSVNRGTYVQTVCD